MFYKYWFYFSIISDGTTDAEEPYLIPDGSMTGQVYANDVIETQNQNQDSDGGV